MDDLQRIDVSRIGDQLITLLTDPTSNLQAALILYGIIGLLVLIILVAGIVLLMGIPDDEEETDGLEAEYGESEADGVLTVPDEEAVVAEELPAPPRTAKSLLITLAVVGVLFAAVWVLTGFTTSTNAVCNACHLNTVHNKAEDGKDPHGSSDCVSCHEPGGVVGRYTTAVPSRILHFVEGGTGLEGASRLRSRRVVGVLGMPQEVPCGSLGQPGERRPHVSRRAARGEGDMSWTVTR